MNQKGYITLISVLVLGAIGTAIAVAILLIGISTSQNAAIYRQSSIAEATATACVEEGLQKIRENTNFTGTGNLTFSPGTCTYTVSDQAGVRTVVGVGVMNSTTRKATAIISAFNPMITLTSWQEG